MGKIKLFARPGVGCEMETVYEIDNRVLGLVCVGLVILFVSFEAGRRVARCMPETTKSVV